MAKQKFGLGRGLDALITGASEVMASQQLTPNGETGNTLHAPIDSIIPNPRQPRRVFREDDPKLLELSASIKEHGLIQPIIVTRLDTLAAASGEEPKKDTGSWFNQDEHTASTQDTTLALQGVLYQIIAGERRWRASRLAGLSKVPVVIKEVTPQQMLEMALIENIQRADLNPIEEALAYQTLIQDFGLTQEQVARQVGKDRSTITNSVRLLQLAPKVRDALVNQPEHFSEGHARALIGIAREEDQITAMGKIIALKLNVRQAEELAASIKGKEDVNAVIERMTTPQPRPAEVQELETHFRDALMVKVDLKKNAKGKGTLVLHFNDQEELERLYSRLVKQREA
ncbi:MAG: ParB/RepB/Spo0J family partition protein [Ktedonobacteraceae bacterium]